MTEDPDFYAHIATGFSKRRDPERAHYFAARSITARSEWVLVNGRWLPRNNIMRKD